MAELMVFPDDDTTHVVKTNFFNNKGELIVSMLSYIDLSSVADNIDMARVNLIKYIGTLDFLADKDTGINVKQVAGFTVRVSEYKK